MEGAQGDGYATTEAQYRFWDHNLPMGRVAHLHVLDVASGRIVDLFEGTAYELQRMDPDANVFDIAPDGRHIAFVFDPAAEKRLDNCKALAELNVRSGRIATIALDAGLGLRGAALQPDGTQIAFVAANIGKRHTAPASLALLERGGAWKVLTGAWDHAVNAPLRWSRDGRALYFSAEDRGRCHLYRYAIESRSAAIVAAGGWLHGFDVAGDTVVTAADAMRHPARVHARRDGGAALRLERFNDELLASLRLGECEEVTFKGACGEPVQMWLVYPPGFDREEEVPGAAQHPRRPARGRRRHLPLPLEQPGVRRAGLRRRLRQLPRLERLRPGLPRQHHAPLGRARAAGRRGRHRLAAEAAVGRQGRVFATGGSYGGYMVAWMNGHPGRYKAYVCHAGCFDWTAMFSDDAYTWHAKELGAWYWDDPAKVQAQSPEHLRRRDEDADAGDPRRARLPRARPAGPGLLQHAEGQAASRRGCSGFPTRTTGS